MDRSLSNDDWIVERGGDVVEARAENPARLTEWQRLVYCLWAADYMMRNAGDFANAVDLCPEFQADARRLSASLSMPETHAAFCLSIDDLQREYFRRFDTIYREIRAADPMR